MAKAILTHKLSKVYSTKRKKELWVEALKDLDLDVEEGDIFGFVGPNGAGKTTVIKILAGLLYPTSGDAFIFDRRAGSMEAKKMIGYLSEVSSYYTFMEGDALLDFYASLYGMASNQRKKKIKEVFKLVGLEDKARTKLSEYSKGMLQRFGIAQAIINDSPLLILDEPTSGLDPILQRAVLDILLKLKQLGKTIFFSSHQLSEVEGLCDKIGVIHQGRLLFSGSIGQLYELYKKEEIVIRFMAREDVALILEGKGLPVQSSKKEYYLSIHPEKTDSVLDMLRDKGARIISLNPSIPSLEEIFLKMIGEET